MNNLKLVGIDMAKTVFQSHGVNDANRVVLRKRLHRDQLLAFIAQLPLCRIVMEACGGTRHWDRQMRALGHQVQLIAPQHVKRYVRGNKNDRHDARAICSAALEPEMVYVAIKSIEQQDIQALHRVREQVNKQRTALSNELRGLRR
jgi:transposase